MNPRSFATSYRVLAEIYCHYPQEGLDAPPGRVYTSDDMTTQRPGFEPDQIAQAVSVGLCLVLAAVLIVLALI